MSDPTVSAGLARGLMELAVAKGAGRDALAECAGIDPALLEDQDGRVPLANYAALMRAGKALTGDAALALHYGESVDMSEFSAVGLLFRASETLIEAMAQINRYGQLVVEVDVGAADRFQLERRDDGLWIVDTRRDPDDFPELTEATFARFIAMTRRLGFTSLVHEVHVTHRPPAHRADYDRIFAAPTLFEAGWNAMRIDEAGLTQRLTAEPRYVFGIFSEHAAALLASLESAKTMRGRVEGMLMPVLHTGEAGIEMVSARLGVSRQTLFRRLRAEGTTFEKILDSLRHKLALHYLDGKRVSVNETAYLVGFSDPAAFSRAFKRWTGTSPRGARK